MDHRAERRFPHVLAVGIAALLAAIAAIAGWRLWPRTDEDALGAVAVAPVPAPPPAPPAVERALVLAAAGPVERSARGDAWTAVQAGDVLRVPESIRTRDGGTVQLDLGLGTRVSLSERTEASVRELTAAAHRVGLAAGRVSVEQPPGGQRSVRIEDGSGEVGASSAAGRWHVVAAAGGAIGVVADEGTVRVDSGGTSVEVPPGHESAAWRGAAPLAPAPVPRELLLRVARALDERRRACAVVRGTADPASELWIGEQRVAIGPDGAFSVVVPRGPRPEVELALRHASGRVDRRAVRCVGPEISGFEVHWDAR